MLLLSACGGGGGGDNAPNTGGASLAAGLPAMSGLDPKETAYLTAATRPQTARQAHRFLEQATFGPTATDMQALQTLGYSAWIDSQLGLASVQASHVDMVAASTQWRGADKARQPQLLHSWWTHALAEPNQLRHRLAYAMSQIFVVSTQNPDLADNSRLMASYLDMLTQRSTGTYRELIEAVALHPAMGMYLSHLGNRKEDLVAGRTPDENFAREVMQLFSIGLYELNMDGSVVLRNGQPVPTYQASDVAGMAKVFTGWSWHRPVGNSANWWECFWRNGSCNVPAQQEVMPMTAYPQEHATSEKRFLGVVVPVQTTADPRASLKVALDRLASHPNTAPFISRQLIQRLVTSNPSAAYVLRVSQVFRSTGGQFGMVAKAILMDPEAQDPQASVDIDTFGKLKEPVLRLTQLMRAMEHRSARFSSATGQPFYRAEDTSNPAYGLGQSPMHAPSVFNFYRPAYVPPQTMFSERQLVAPEMQLSTESTVVGYVNFLSRILQQGWGETDVATGQPDIQFDYTALMALDVGSNVSAAQALVDEVGRRLLGEVPEASLRAQVVATVSSMPRGTLSEKRQRVITAVLAIAASPAFIVQY